MGNKGLAVGHHHTQQVQTVWYKAFPDSESVHQRWDQDVQSKNYWSLFNSYCNTSAYRIYCHSTIAEEKKKNSLHKEFQRKKEAW